LSYKIQDRAVVGNSAEEVEKEQSVKCSNNQECAVTHTRGSVSKIGYGTASLAVEHLPRLCEALDLIPIVAKTTQRVSIEGNKVIKRSAGQPGDYISKN
jgi:hypothetical protein